MSLGRRNTWLCLFLGDGATAEHPNNSTYWRTIELRLHSTNFVRLPNHTVLPLPACQTIFDSTGYLTSRDTHAQNRIPEYELRAYLKRNDWSDKVYDSISCLLTDQPLLDTLTVPDICHQSWLLLTHRCTRTTMQR
jgi:hypothetical protein